MKKRKKLKGDSININYLLLGQTDPDIPNVSPEVLKEMWECAKPKVSKPVGKLIVFGTGGEFKP